MRKPSRLSVNYVYIINLDTKHGSTILHIMPSSRQHSAAINPMLIISSWCLCSVSAECEVSSHNQVAVLHVSWWHSHWVPSSQFYDNWLSIRSHHEAPVSEVWLILLTTANTVIEIEDYF